MLVVFFIFYFLVPFLNTLFIYFSPLLKHQADLVNLLVENTVGTEVSPYFFTRVDNGCMVTSPKLISNCWKRNSKVLPQEIHNHLPRTDHLLSPRFFINTHFFNSIEAGDCF